ncbi:MAG TPA: Hsp70 family protein [Planktothrix sp.]
MNEQQPTTIPTEPRIPATKTEPKRQRGGPDFGINASDGIVVDTKPNAALGIDIGTHTTSAAAFFDGAVHFIEPSRMRSTIYISEERKVFVGMSPDDAKSDGIFIDGIKPLLGSDYNVQVGRTTRWNAIDCMSQILSGARAYAQRQLSMDVTKAVLTVPHTFNARQRKLLKSCAEKAGLQPIALIHETTAAALNYCFENERDNCTLMVVSMGAAFLSVSLIDVHNKVVEVKYTSGEVWLGGTSFDERIERWLRQYIEEIGSSFDQTDSIAHVKIKAACEESKLRLLGGQFNRYGLPCAPPFTAKNPLTSATIHLALLRLNDLSDDKKELELKGSVFESLTSDILQNICHCVEDVSSVAARDGIKPERVLFVGNATRAPFLWSTIAKAACKGVTPDAENENCDLYAAAGASLYAALLTKQLLEWVVWDTLTIPIGVEAANGQFKTLISKDTPLPVIVHHSVEMPESGRLKLKFVQGNDVIDEIVIKDASAGLPRPRKVEAAIHVHHDGTVSYSARDLELGVNLSVDVDAEEPVLVELA